MKYANKTIPFPAQTFISFSKLINHLKEKSGTDYNIENTDTLLQACSLNEKLVSGLTEDEFDSEIEIIKKLCGTLFPKVLRNNEIKGVIPPFEFRPFFVSHRFDKILKESGAEFSFELNNFDQNQMYIFGCNTILQFYYGYPSLMSMPNLVNIPYGTRGEEKTYRLVMNGDLLEIEPAGSVQEFTKEDWLELLSDFDNLALWKKKFPPNSWIMKGIGIVTLFDVTSDQALVKLISRLLTSQLQSLDEIAAELGKLLDVEDLTLGFLDHNDDSFSAGQSGFQSLILKGNIDLPFKQNLCAPSYQKLIINKNPIIITDVEKWNTTSSCSMVSTLAEKASAGSYIILPVRHQNEILGYLELASKVPYKLNGSSILKINLLLPTLGMAIKRNRNELQNRVEALIQQKCTTIHPSVKWRFEEEALNAINVIDPTIEDGEFSDIIFKEVFPLYGQLDISGSSKKRNEAVQIDMQKQLQKVEEILNLLWVDSMTPIQEEMLFRIHKFNEQLKQELSSGTEENINYFLQHEVHPLLEMYKMDVKAVQPINEYFALLNAITQTLYEKRKQFDKSVSLINRMLASGLDKKQVHAQKMFPHYFERYKTDGIEFNMYIGQSILPSKNFSITDLHNLQLWQLMTICELEREYRRLKNRLSLDLDIASLILVFTTPLTIHFRMDEKKFDVDGAYNARYEIIKKRIDKALIKSTQERLTSPGKIAIIYGNEKDAEYYERFISFLQNKGMITGEATEVLEVEDLPGISGLKALRVSIDYSNTVTE